MREKTTNVCRNRMGRHAMHFAHRILNKIWECFFAKKKCRDRAYASSPKSSVFLLCPSAQPDTARATESPMSKRVPMNFVSLHGAQAHLQAAFKPNATIIHEDLSSTTLGHHHT
jgi:hypothetical protein